MSLPSKPKQLKQDPISPCSQNNTLIFSLIFSDPLLKAYFKQHSEEKNYIEFAKKLMLDGIRYRSTEFQNQEKVPLIQTTYMNSPSRPTNIKPINQRLNDKHYNVAYIKHNRFLSPKQKKQQVAPKITEVIPAKSPPHKIYGKPKIKPDELYGCPYHEQDEEQYLRSFQRKSEDKKFRFQQSPAYENNSKNYLSSQKIPQKDTQYKYYHQQSQESQVSSTFNEPKPIRRKTRNQDAVYVDKIIKVQTKKPVKVIQAEKDSNDEESQYLKTRIKREKKEKKKQRQYKKIQSKIKCLIDRDKHNKNLQKKLKQQGQKLKQLEKKMENQSKKQKKPVIRISSKDIFSLSQDSNEFSSVEEQAINKGFKTTNIRDLKEYTQQSIQQSNQFSDHEVPEERVDQFDEEEDGSFSQFEGNY